MPYAVIDFETTGLVPERTDRVVEVGIVLTDDDGRIEREWTTLVNPHRDIGATHIHGIPAGDVLDAPDFADISDYLLEMLSGRVLVAHNASFDMRFLHRELQLARYEIPSRPTALCSMKWAGRMIGAAKLSHCCEALGISLTHAHSALGDAHATAELLPHLIGTCCSFPEWHTDLARCSSYTWPASFGRATHAVAVHRGQATADPHAWLRSVLRAAWIPATPENEAAYMVVLDNALLDRSISRSEGRQLLETAESSGLSRGTVARLHQDYLRSVAREALADGVVTDFERAELDTVALSLGFGSPYVDEALAWASADVAPEKEGTGFALQTGDRVVFTGEMKRGRDEWVSAICAAGLASGGITKSTRILVAADPDSQSGKAAKARLYGIPVVGEEAFEQIFAKYRAAG